MHVAIDDGNALDQLVAAEGANRDGDIVQNAKAFAVIGKSVMRAAREIRSDARRERGACGCKRPSRRQKRTTHERLRPRQSEPSQLARRERSGAQARHVVLRVNQQHVCDGRGLRFDDLRRRERAFAEQTVAHEFKLANRKDVPLADVGVITWSVEDVHENVRGQ
jgi:hypothetical protein